MSSLDSLLFVLLDCGSLDISILDDVGYDLGDITVKIEGKGRRTERKAKALQKDYQL